ncbi:MAG: agmatinase [Desulforudis sp.]|jgi:agmatinase|nr:MAG: agmatinase [Desulforudis sp.]
MKQTNPWGGLYEPNLDAADVVILGIPFDGAVSAGKGAAEAPDRLRDLSRILPATTEEGFLLKGLRVRDEGNVPKNLDWEEYFRQVEEQAFALLSTGKRCLFLGGDHSISIPLEKAYARTCGGESVGIIHFDSHTDIADEFDGHRWSHACVQRRALELLNVKPEGLTFLGIRSYEEEELHFLSEHPEIRVIGAREIFRKGLDSVLAQVYDRYRDYRHIYMTIDIDVLDPAFAPGTGTPEAGGLSTRELIELVREMTTALPVQAVDIVEVSPPLDSSDITSWAALKVVYELFGAFALGKQV